LVSKGARTCAIR